MWTMELAPFPLPAPVEKQDLRLQMKPKQNKPAEIWSHWRDPSFSVILVKPIEANMGYCVLPPNTYPVPRAASLGSRERSRGCRYLFPLLGWTLRSEACSGFCAQLHTHLRSSPGKGSLYLHVQRSRASEAQPVSSCRDKVLAAGMTRTGTAPKPTVGTAPGKDGEDLALLQHLGSLETLSKAAGWGGLHLIPAGWGYSSAQLEVPRAPLPSTPHCPLTEPTKLLKPGPKSAPSDGQ